MTGQIEIAPTSTAPLRGDPSPLLEQLGSPGDLAVPAQALTAAQFEQVRSLAGLTAFLRDYQQRILIPLELPMIERAWRHTSRNELRELVALDASLAADPALKAFAAASCRVGQRQLNRLRPMRDHRFVQRYIAAIEDGRARGWHTLVFGVTLATFCLPLRQGLVSYGERTLGGFVAGAARPLALTHTQCADIHAQLCAELPATVNGLLSQTGRAELQVQ